MLFKPSPLSDPMEPQTLEQDFKSCKRFGPCGVGEKALYLNSFFIDRRYYLPVSKVTRAFKRIAMSKGGFSGKGLFASIPYLVVEADGQQRQFIFKNEEEVDLLLACLAQRFPTIPLLSAEQERRLAERKPEPKVEISASAQAEAEQLERAETFLARFPEAAAELSAAAKAKRVSECANPAYRWVALAIVLAGVVSLVYGLIELKNSANIGLYFTLFGLAAIFFFSGAHVLPTARSNREAVENRLREAQRQMERITRQYGETFPVPARYAHPIVLRRMARLIRFGKAETAAQAYEQMKEELKRLNASVQVEQWEYDEVIVVKPLFLVENYQ